ncbi:MAG: ion transporter, partial [Planctomycetota bacterium]
QFLASIVMILGYSIIAVPTGIMTVEISHAYKAQRIGRVCTDCGKEGHDSDAQHCKFCGSKL